MPLRLSVEPGGERWLSFAKQKLAQLKTWMTRADVRVMSKHFQIGPDTIWVKSQLLGDDTPLDWIRITAGSGRGFVLYIKMARFDPADEFVITLPVLLNLKGLSIKDIPGDPVQAGPPYRNSGDKVAAPATGGYFSNSKFSASTGLALDTLPFVHTYTEQVDGQPVQRDKLLGVRVSSTNPDVRNLSVNPSVVLSSTGTAGQVHDVSPDGRSAVGLVGDEKTVVAIDYAASPQVTKSTETLSGYGTQSATTDQFATDNNMNGEAQHANFSEVLSAEYPVCFGYSSGNTPVSITLAVSSANISTKSLNTLRTITSPGEGNTSSSGAWGRTNTTDWTLTLPNGVTRVFPIARWVYAASGSYSNTFTGGSIDSSSGGASGSSSRTDGELDILYADASASVVVYRYTVKVYHYSMSSFTDVTAVTFGQSGTPTMTKTTTVVALVGAEEYEIFSDVVTEASDLDPVPVFPATPSLGGGSGLDGIAGFFSGLLSTINETVDTPIDTTGITAPAARKQSMTLGISIKDASRLVWQYTHTFDSIHIGGVGDPLEAAKDELAKALVADEAQLPDAIAAQYLRDLGVTSEELTALMAGAGYTDVEAAAFRALFDTAPLEGLTGYAITISSGAIPGIGLL